MIRIQNDLVPTRSGQIFIAAVTLFSALGMTYFGVLGLIDPGALVPGGGTEAAQTFASYMAPRNLALAGGAVVLLARRRWRALSLVLLLNAVVQAGDAILGAVRGDAVQTISPLVLAVALFAAVAAIQRREPATGSVAT